MTGQPETEQERKSKKLIEDLEAFQLLCKQMDHHAGILLQSMRQETPVDAKQ